MKLTYNFNNDEKTLNIEKIEYLEPEETVIYTREGDKLYVADGDYVYINQLIKEAENGIKTYATISGTIEMSTGVIKIINDNSESTIISEDTNDDISDLKRESIINACRDLGIDYENKLIADKIKNNSKVLVVNAMDIEPYQFNNNYLFEEKVKDLLETIELLSSKFNLKANLLLNKYDDNNIKSVKKYINEYPSINFKVIEDVYPYTTNRLIAFNYFKDYRFEDILFVDTFALNKLYIALKEGVPVSERYVTVCIGNAEKVSVVKCRYGTYLKKVLEDAVGADLFGKDIYLNNFMRKIKCENIDSVIVSDNIKTIFIFDKDEFLPSKCIKCGKCVDVCPVNINPLANKIDPSCIRCGLCNYVCPSNINLLKKEG